MRANGNAAPVIIKRKKVVAGGGHHGGAWKVAYADFVTAMMAFFMLMWLLNATTEKQRKGLADYFSPSIPLSRVSGGGDGAFGGESVFAQVARPHEGTGATSALPAERRGGSAAAEADARAFARLQEALEAAGGESMAANELLRHIATRVTDEGLVVELSEREGAAFFDGENRPTDLLRALLRLVAEVSRLVENPVAVEAHVRAFPVVLARSPAWDLTAARAEAARELLDRAGLGAQRVARLTGHADRGADPAAPMAARNNRIAVIFLRGAGADGH